MSTFRAILRLSVTRSRRLIVFLQALLNLPEKVGVTANLNINYKAPTRADQFIVIKVRLDEAQGRKSRVSGVVEDMAGNVLVEAKCVPDCSYSPLY